MSEGLKIVSDYLSMSKINLLKFQFQNRVSRENEIMSDIVMYFGPFPYHDGDEMLMVLFENCTNIEINNDLFDGVRRPAILLYDVTDKNKTTNVCRVEEDAGLFSFWCEEVTYKRIKKKKKKKE